MGSFSSSYQAVKICSRKYSVVQFGRSATPQLSLGWILMRRNGEYTYSSKWLIIYSIQVAEIISVVFFSSRHWLDWKT